ncbi:unnamed protein product [Dicrocoelium dendriticum]|nr:unnamed protein product [Dicrocoelium dendriticum]
MNGSIKTSAVLERIRWKLKSLNYPAASSFVADDLKQVRNLVVWLEDRTIRFYQAGKRLRDIESSDWQSYIKEYLDSVKCPFSESEPLALCDWLVGKALILDCKPGDSNDSSATMTSASPQYAAPDLFNRVDIYGSEFKECVAKLAKTLHIPSHPDPVTTFKAVCLLIKQKLSRENIEQALEEYGTVESGMLKPSEVCLGFEVDDPLVRTAAVALRLLNVNEMRRLQDHANAAIVRVQELTADPKTNEKLGQVGY